ncbi:cyclase [Penicillium alfredii]|uniref:Cyclase n=1 Tax=Penicillium alfredii TaxID=1506179 RepID=A0A9W9JW96_9EURO|nr:cyclase [Penicillium alfredii]KAJ5083893.1 cyclase [Penicillium alfredii]
MMAPQIPSFDDLPPVEGMPQGCAWGVFDKDGQKDIYGTLNLLTPDVVKAAAAEVQEGISISLNWPIGSIKMPNFFRKSLSHKVLKLEDHQAGLHYGFDDEVEFNTQASSQWDSLCHFMHVPTGLAYNGIQPTVEELQDPTTRQKLPTLDHWHARGGVTGRGVLIDFKSYAEAKGISYSPFSRFRIGISDIEAVAAYQGITFRQGDILIVRFGVTEELGRMNGDEQAAAMSSHHVCGLEGTPEMARWLWNQHFAAVASDNIAVEAMPPIVDGQEQPLIHLVLHQWCLSLFGLPLGELWDLQALADQCEASQRYSFFLTSSPLNVPGGVGSPPNALAIL